MTQEPAVVHEIRDHVAVMFLNRPDNRNSMTPELLDRFAEVTDLVRAAPEVRAVVITGRGSCFSAGADFRSTLQRHAEDHPRQPHEKSYAMYEPFLRVLDLEVPVIGALNGHAVGGGFGLALLCDMRVGNCDAKYGANFAKLGLCSGMAISYLLPRLVGLARASELLFTGRLVRGSEAHGMGLFNDAVPADRVLPRALELAAEVAAAAPYAVRSMKHVMRQGLGWEVRRAAWAEAYAQAASLETADAKEGMSALLEKRTPTFHGR